LKLIVALTGAAVIFVTFLVKDARRDKLKELVDSVDAAENAFIIRMGNRQTLAEIKRFERQFQEFREHPTRPLRHNSSGGGGSSYDFGDDTQVNFNGLYTVRAEELSNEDLLDNIVRLANKLPKGEGERKRLQSIQDDTKEFWTKWYAAFDESFKVNSLPREQRSDAPKQANEHIYSAVTIEETVARMLESITDNVFQEAERERERAEADYAVWNVITYFFYGVGFIIGVIGILMGSGEKDGVIGAIAEEI